jgi:hypothetical protein
LPQVNTVADKPGRRAIGFLIEPNSSPLPHCGLEVLAGDIIVNGFDVTHQRSDANFHYGTMSLPLDDLDAAAEAIIGREFPKTLHKRIIRPRSALMLRLLTLHKSVGQLAHDSPDVLELPEVLRAFENELIHVMVRCLAVLRLRTLTLQLRGPSNIWDADRAPDPTPIHIHRSPYWPALRFGLHARRRDDRSTVSGPLTFTDPKSMLEECLAGTGIAQVIGCRSIGRRFDADSPLTGVSMMAIWVTMVLHRGAPPSFSGGSRNAWF